MGQMTERPPLEEPESVPVTFATGFEVITKGGISEKVYYQDRYLGHGRRARRVVVQRIVMETHKLEDSLHETEFSCVRANCEKRVKPIKL